MKKYLYQAKTSTGKNCQGSIQAGSSREAIETLRSQKYIIINLTEKKPILTHYTKISLLSHTKIKQNNIITFCRQLSILLKSGISLDDAIFTIHEQCPDKFFKNILYDISLQIKTGKSLSESLYIYKEFFPHNLLSLISIGEASGKLDNILNDSASYLERDYLAKEKLKTAAIYPLILISTFFITAAIMITFILPMFTTMLHNIHIPLPLITKIILLSGKFVREYNSAIVIALFILFFIIKLLWHNEHNKLLFFTTILKVPVLNTLLLETKIFQFSNNLNIMLSAGITIDKAINVILSSTTNVYCKRILQTAQNCIQKGFPLSAALLKEHIFPPLFMQMLLTGEKSGNLSYTMRQSAKFYQNDIDILYKRITAFAEPFMIIVLSLLIGTFVIGIALPMFDAASKLPM